MLAALLLNLPDYQARDTHDGFWAGMWKRAAEAERKRRIESLEELQDDLEIVENLITEVKQAPLPKNPVIINAIPVPPIQARLEIIERLIVKAAQLRQEIEDEEFILLMM